MSDPAPARTAVVDADTTEAPGASFAEPNEHAQVEVIPPRPEPVPGTQPFDLAGEVSASEFAALAAQARLLHMSGAAPKAIRENIYVAFHVAMAGRDYGISPTAAMDLIDVLKSRDGGYQLAPSPQLLNGQVERLGLGKIVPFIRTKERCVALALEPGGRADVRCRPFWPEHRQDKDGNPLECVCAGIIGDSEFTWDMAIGAQLVKPNCRPGDHKCLPHDKRCQQGYITYPERMLWWRAAGFCADDWFPQASLGRYTPEALNAIIDVEGRAIDPTTVPVPEGYEPEPTAAEKRAVEEAADPELQAQLAADRAALQERLDALPDEQRRLLAERWKENPDLRAYKLANLPRAKMRLVGSMLTGFETAAKRDGWDQEAALAAVRAKTGAESPQDAQQAPDDPNPTPEADSAHSETPPPDPAATAAPAPPDWASLAADVRGEIKLHLTGPATQGQRGKVVGLIQGWGVTDREERLRVLEVLIGRRFTTSNELSRGEAGAIIETVPAAPKPAKPPAEGADPVDAVIERVRAMAPDEVDAELVKARLPTTGPVQARQVRLAEHLVQPVKPAP